MTHDDPPKAEDKNPLGPDPVIDELNGIGTVPDRQRLRGLLDDHRDLIGFLDALLSDPLPDHHRNVLGDQQALSSQLRGVAEIVADVSGSGEDWTCSFDVVAAGSPARVTLLDGQRIEVEIPAHPDL